MEMVSPLTRNVCILPLLLGMLLVTAPLARAHGAGDLDELFNDLTGENAEDYEEGELVPILEFDEIDVVDLNSENFDKIVKSAPFAMVEFIVPWCEHSRLLLPQFAAAATEITAINDSIVFGKVDCTVNDELQQSFNIEGYPTVLWFVNGQMVEEFDEDRERSAIVDYVLQKIGPPSITVSTLEELAEQEKKKQALIVGYFKEAQGNSYEAFISVARETFGPFFVHITVPEVAAAAGINRVNGVSIIRNFGGEREVVPFNGKYGISALHHFINEEKRPVVIEFNEENLDTIFRTGSGKQVFFWGTVDDFQPGAAAMEAFKAVAANKLCRGKLVFVFADKAKEKTESLTKIISFEGSAPAVGALHRDRRMKYKFTEEIEEEGLLNWVSTIINNTAIPIHKSAPEPKRPIENGVQIVVGSTVQSIVMNATMDVLLMVYAPSCGHCKTFSPQYSDLAKRFSKIESVLIAKYDGTTNDHPAVYASQFPTILFFPAGQVDAIEFVEPRTMDHLVEFIKDQAMIPFHHSRIESIDQHDHEYADGLDDDHDEL